MFQDNSQHQKQLFFFLIFEELKLSLRPYYQTQAEKLKYITYIMSNLLSLSRVKNNDANFLNILLNINK
jgi:hypothetical protein